jgi:hypothetical protein
MIPFIHGNSYEIVQAPGVVGITVRTDSRNACDPARRPAARRQSSSPRHGPTREVIGRAIRSSSRPPTSNQRSAYRNADRCHRCASSSASRGHRRIRSSGLSP